MSDEGADEQPQTPPPVPPGWSPDQPPPANQPPSWTPAWRQPGSPTPPPPPPGQPPPPPPGATPPAAGQPYPPPGYQPPPPPGYPGHPGYSYAPPAAPKPGVIPLRPLSVGEILDGAIQCVRANPKIMLGLSAIVVTVTQLISFGLTAVLVRGLSADLATLDPDTANVDEVFAPSSGLLSASLIGYVISALAQVVLAGILTVVVGRAVLGRSITLGEAWTQLRPRIWPLIGAAILVLVLSSLGLVACILPGVWLYVMWWLATPAVVLERAGVTTAMRRSWNLVKGAFWRTFLIVLLTVILTVVISGIVSLPFQLLSGFTMFTSGTEDFGTISTASLLASTLGSIVGGTLTYPFTAAVTVLVYVDRRMRLEGLDLELARAAGVPPRQ